MFTDHRFALRKIALVIIACSTLGTAKPLRFIYEAFKQPQVVGALFECSSYTAEELIRYMQTLPDGKRIVELGAGTGAVTEVIVDNMAPNDHLVLIEINAEYASILEEKFSKSEYPNVEVVCMDVRDYQATQPFDVCICTIPFNSFTCDLAKEISAKMLSLVRPGGYLSRVEYIFLPYVNKYALKWGKRREDFACLLGHMRSLDAKYEFDRATIVRNMPPLHVHHWQIGL